jgi:hypothetical protein
MSSPVTIDGGDLEPTDHHALRKLHIVDRDDPVRKIVAQKVIDICEGGVTDAVAIGEIAYRMLSPARCCLLTM